MTARLCFWLYVASLACVCTAAVVGCVFMATFGEWRMATMFGAAILILLLTMTGGSR